MIDIRYVQQEDRDFWYSLDRHLPGSGYKDSGGLVIDIPGYEQPMELFMIKAI